MPDSQQAFGKIANLVVNSRLHFARNFIFDRNNQFRSSQPRQAPERYMLCLDKHTAEKPTQKFILFFLPDLFFANAH